MARELNAVEVENFAKLKELPRSTAVYASADNKLEEAHDNYDKLATVEAVVLFDRVHYHDGHRWAFQDETVKLSPKDAKALERAGQVKIVSVAK